MRKPPISPVHNPPAHLPKKPQSISHFSFEHVIYANALKLTTLT